MSRFGAQKCLLVGALISTAGLAVSFFADNITFLVFTIGIIGGKCFVTFCLSLQYYR